MEARMPYLQVVDVVLTVGQALHLLVPLLPLLDLRLQALDHLLGLVGLLQVGLVHDFSQQVLKPLHGVLQVRQHALRTVVDFVDRTLGQTETTQLTVRGGLLEHPHGGGDHSRDAG